eukprot:6184040-Pleurochrysis_carterae.AAC.5
MGDNPTYQESINNFNELLTEQVTSQQRDQCILFIPQGGFQPQSFRHAPMISHVTISMNV